MTSEWFGYLYERPCKAHVCLKRKKTKQVEAVCVASPRRNALLLLPFTLLVPREASFRRHWYQIKSLWPAGIDRKSKASHLQRVCLAYLIFWKLQFSKYSGRNLGAGKKGKGGLKPECVLTDGHIDCVLGPSDLSVYNLLGLVITVCQGLLGETKEEEEGQQASPCL